MMRKRARTSDPKLNMPLRQTNKSVKKPAKSENEEKVTLDYLVLVMIASFSKAPVLSSLRRHPATRQELVSSTFASALRSFYSTERVKLWLTPCSVSSNWKKDSVYLYLSGFAKRSMEMLTVKVERLKEAVRYIFSRFPQISLKLDYSNPEFPSIIQDALNTFRDVTIESLKISLNYHEACRYHELIERLSTTLKVLKLGIHLDESMDESLLKEFWQAVSSCPKLDSLSVEAFFFSECSERLYVLKHMEEYLKEIKVKCFRTRLELDDSNADALEWLLKTLTKNENFHKFELCTGRDNLGRFCFKKDGLLALGQLDLLTIRTETDGSELNDWEFTIGNIVQALSNHAVLQVIVNFWADNGKEIVHALSQICLKLSQETTKSIKLVIKQGPCFDKYERCPLRSAAAIVKEALKHLKSRKEFRGLTTMRCGKWTKITLGNATLMIKARVNYRMNHWDH